MVPRSLTCFWQRKSPPACSKKHRKRKYNSAHWTPPPLLLTVALSTALALFPLSQYARAANPKTGKFIKSIDKAPSPFKHTQVLYNGKSKHQSTILCQLRTGICRLNRYLGKIGAALTTECACKKGVETVDHFLFRCPLWSDLRQRNSPASRSQVGRYLIFSWGLVRGSKKRSIC